MSGPASDSPARFWPHALTLLLFAAAAGGSATRAEWGKVASALGWIGFALLMCAAAVAAALHNKGTRRLGWLTFAAAGAISLVGLGSWLGGISGDYPGFADYLFLAATPLLVLGMLAMYPRWQTGLYRVIASLDTGILGCAAGIILTLSLYDPVATSQRSTAYIVTTLAVPVFWAAAALSGLRLVWLLAGRGLRRSELLLALAISVHAVCAVLYAAQMLQEGYSVGVPLDAGYHASSALFVLGALEETRLRPGQHSTALRAKAPPGAVQGAVPAVAIFAVLLTSWVLGDRRPRAAEPFLYPVALLALSLGAARGIVVWRLREQLRVMADTAAAQMRASDDRLGVVVNTLAEGLLTTDLEDRVTWLNKRLTELTGYIATDLLGKVAAEVLLDPPQRKQMLERIAERKAGHAEQYEIDVRCKDGRKVRCLVNAVPLRNAEGAIIGTLGALTDISELRTLQEQYRHAQRMEAIGRLAGGIAHDFNNLLTVISGQADLVHHRLPPTDPNLHAVEAIQSAALRAGAITQQLLAFSRKQKLQPRRLDLAAQVRGLCNTLSRSLGSGVRVETSLPPGEVPVEADPGQLDQVLLNLLVNARDAMPEGGRVTVELRRAAPWAVLTVSDEGTGIAPEVLPRIFEPFFTTKGESKGTGLGLATVYGVVKQSGGDIKVTSQTGRGTSFEVRLPLLKEAMTASTHTSPPKKAGPRQRVMLVDDDDEIRQLLEHALLARDFDVQTAPHGAAALQKLTEQGGSADLLVTDLVMPELDGAALAQRVGETWPGMRILMITGYADDEIASAETLGRYRLLRKPFSLPQFLEQVDTALHTAEKGA